MRLVCLRTRSFTNDYRHSLMIHPPVNSVSRTDRRITYLWPLCLRPFQLLADSPCTGSSPRSLLICDQRSQPRSGPLTPVRAHSWLPDLTGLRPLPAQPVDGLSAFGPLISYAIPSISRPPLRLRAMQSPLLRISPEVLFRYITRFQQHPSLAYGFNVSPRLVLDEGVMTFGYLWQAGSCGFLGSYCFPFFIHLSYPTHVSCISDPN